MIEKQYETIMEIHGNWIDRALERAYREWTKSFPHAGPWSPIKFAAKVRSYKAEMPDGLKTLRDQHLLGLVERRLEAITSSGLAKRGPTRRGWNTYTVLEVLDALAGL